MQMSSATVASCGKIALKSLTALPAPVKRVLRRQTHQLRPLKLRDRHPLGERLWHGLALHLGQPRLKVERLQVRRAPSHVEVDNPPDSRRKMQRADGPFPSLALPRSIRRAFRLLILTAQHGRIEERRQCQRPDSPGRAAQKRTPVQPNLAVVASVRSSTTQLREIVSCRFKSTRATDVQAASSTGSMSGGFGSRPVESKARAAAGSARYWS